MTETDEIKAKLDIVQLISEYVPNLKQSGSNWKAPCPFHNEKTPSFMVSSDKQIYKCFGCGEGGDIFTFVQKIEGLEFVEALRLLARKAGVELKSSYNPKMQTEKTKVLEILNQACAYYQKYLLTPPGQRALKYFQDRGLEQVTIDEFNLGYSPDAWDGIYKFLKGQKFLDQDIAKAGLIIKKQGSYSYYDRFRNRLMFPIMDWHGNVLGFSARALDSADDQAKYINSPQTLVYDKSSVLYGLDRAKQDIRRENKIVLVEGNMDVISSHQAGIKNVVAISGTALTNEQIKLIKRYTDNVYLCFDNDQAGVSAMRKSIDLLVQEECNVKVIILQGAKDPDELVKQDPKLWQQAIDQAVYIMEFHLQKAMAGKKLQNIEHKKLIAKDLLQEIAKLRQKIEQDLWINRLSDMLGVKAEFLWEALNKTKRQRINETSKQRNNDDNNQNKNIATPRDLKKNLMNLILGIAFQYPENIDYLVDNLELEVLANNELQEFYKKFILLYNEFKQNNLSTGAKVGNFIDFFNKKVHEQEQTLVNELTLYAEESLLDLSKAQIVKEFIMNINALKLKFYNQAIVTLEQQIKSLEIGGSQDKQLLEKLLKKYNYLLKQKESVSNI